MGVTTEIFFSLGLVVVFIALIGAFALYHIGKKYGESKGYNAKQMGDALQPENTEKDLDNGTF